MATGIELNKTSIGSEEIFDNCCSPCSDSGRIREGTLFCQECDYFFCDQCLKDHNKFPSLRSHKIVDKSTDGFFRGGENTNTVCELSDRCIAHCGKIIDMFCKDHDEVCCKACVTIKHRSCNGLDSIRNVVKGIHNSKELKDTKKNLANVEVRIKAEKENRNSYISGLNHKKNAILKDIDKYQDDIIVRIKEIAEDSRREVKAKHAELVQSIEAESKELDTVLMLTEETTKKLNATGINEVELFTNTKSGKKIAGDVEIILDELSDNRDDNTFEYCFDNGTTDRYFNLISFGHIRDNKKNRQYQVTICKKINVKPENDTQYSHCDITGICLLGDDTVIISDFRNKSMKRLDNNDKVTDKLNLDGSPIAVCVVGQDEVAVALRDKKKVHFVSCGKTLMLGNSFDTELRCTGLYFDFIRGEIYVSCGAKWKGDNQAKLNVYTKEGTLLRTYERNKEGSPLFSSPNNITMVSGVIYIADRENGLIAMTKNGYNLWMFTNAKLEGPWGLCVLPGNQLFVGGYDSTNIIQVGGDGKEVCELLGQSEGLYRPYAVTYDNKHSRLLVGCSSDKISVYTLSRKT